MPEEPIHPETIIGHVHLKVSDLERAVGSKETHPCAAVDGEADLFDGFDVAIAALEEAAQRLAQPGLALGHCVGLAQRLDADGDGGRGGSGAVRARFVLLRLAVEHAFACLLTGMACE